MHSMGCAGRNPGSRLAGASFAIGLVVATVPSRADDARFAVDRLEPAERGSEWLVNDSLDFRGELRPTLGVVSTTMHRPIVVTNAGGGAVAPLSDAFVIHAGGSIKLVDRLRLALDVPFQVGADGTTATSADGIAFGAPKRSEGVGDLRLGADVRVFGQHQGPLTAAVGLQMWLPTGQQSQWMSDGTARARPRVMVAGEWRKAFVWAAQLGFGYRERAQRLGNSVIVGSDVRVSVAVGVRVKESLVIGPEIAAATVLDDAFAKRATPVEVLLGAHWLIAGAFRVGAGIGAGLTRAPGAPEHRFVFAIEWTPNVTLDTDHDGVRDDRDRCPLEPGIATDDPKTNGCPLSLGVSDRDGDGIADRDDACPYAPGPRTGDPRTNGCPSDRDRDTVPDDVDACPDVLGVPTKDSRTNGCPPDADGDGIDDLVDACPTVPGLRTDDPRTNGCPDGDRDKDGVANELDACPDDAGVADPDPERNGCPVAYLRYGKIHLARQPAWRANTAELEVDNPILEAIRAVLEAHPEVQRVRVEGHTDNRGNDDANTKASAARADAIVRWLIAHGIDRERLTGKGFGPHRPVDTNETESGRDKNRRIELHVVKP